ncbi:MAG: zinc ribbon domain-containing protein [Pyrinomonadaceae bacterium]|nr:zinc ribbon domain-containing protein [Pyrinomonadaceae bacterium]
MAMIQFVSNYSDLSTDKGYQFKFNCDKCGNGFMSQYQVSTLGMASSLLRSAGGLLGGWAYSAGNSAYEMQRAVGGTAHDSALKIAVEEGKQHFHQCSRCGKWVCPEVCWNAGANQCEGCAPKFEEELASAQAEAKVQAARQQLYERARETDYASGIDMSANSQMASPHSVQPSTPSVTACVSCNYPVPANSKFCTECGASTQVAKPKCRNCNAELEFVTKFCSECGTKTT